MQWIEGLSVWRLDVKKAKEARSRLGSQQAITRLVKAADAKGMCREEAVKAER